MADETTDTPVVNDSDATPDTTSEPTGTVDERRFKFIEEQLAASESETNETPVAEETPAAEVDPDGDGKPAVDPAVATPEKLVLTDEQLADSAYWGSLDKDGWARMERDYPVETKHLRSAQAAATRLVNEARAKTAATAQPAVPAEDQPDPYEEAYRKINSFDEAEVREGHRELVKLEVAQGFKEMGLDPVRIAAKREAEEAYSVALQAVPEIAKISDAELGAAVDADPDLMELLELAESSSDPAHRIKLKSNVMRRAAAAVLSGKKAAEATSAVALKAAADKKAADQKRLRSNASTSAAAIAASPSGNAVKGKQTRLEYIEARLAEAARAAH